MTDNKKKKDITEMGCGTFLLSVVSSLAVMYLKSVYGTQE